MKPNIKTQYNQHVHPKHREKNTMPSETVPDQTMSLKELLDRYARGIPIQGEKQPIYYGDEELMPDLKKMDLSEIHDLKEELQARIKEQQEALVKQKHEEDKKQNEINQRELYKKWKDEEDQQNQPKKGQKGQIPDSER